MLPLGSRVGQHGLYAVCTCLCRLLMLALCQVL
jgi:hypothetical protein